MNLKLYSKTLLHFLTGGDYIIRDNISSIGLTPSIDRITTKKCIKKIWAISGFPVYSQKHFTHFFRDKLTKDFPGVDIIFHVHADVSKVNVKSDMFKNRLASAARGFEEYKKLEYSLSSDQQLTGTTLRGKGGKKMYFSRQNVERRKQLYDSFIYVYKNTLNGDNFYSASVFIEVQAPDSKTMKDFLKVFEKVALQSQVSLKPLRNILSGFLENYGIATYKNVNMKKIPKVLLSDENLALLTPCKTRGVIDTGGILMGMDCRTKYPFAPNFFEAATGQVAVIIGKTGSGKSYSAFMSCLSMVAAGVHCSAVDIKGNEWDKVLKYTKGCRISMSGRHPKFVNTLRLDDLTIDSEEDAFDYYNSAISATVELLVLMTNLHTNEGNLADLRRILDIAVTKVYTSKGITPDNPESFKKSRNLKYSDVLNFLAEADSIKQFTDNMRDVAKMASVRCSRFISGEGAFSQLTKDELTLNDIIDEPMVVYSFDKDVDGIMSDMDTIRVYMVNYLDTKKHSMRRRQNKQSVVYYEEVQRCQNYGTLTKTISEKVTGGRSNNVMVFLLLNALSTFDDPEMAKIKSNISTWIVGKLTSSDVNKLVTEFDCGILEKDLGKMLSGDVRYRHTFAVKYDTGKTEDNVLMKVLLPKDISEHFGTRTIGINK